MEIEIKFTMKDLKTLLAEHCRDHFKVDVKNAEILLSTSLEEYIGVVSGEYRPE